MGSIQESVFAMRLPQTLAAVTSVVLAAIVMGLLLDGKQDTSVVNLSFSSEDATRMASGEFVLPGPDVLATAEAEFAGTATAAP